MDTGLFPFSPPDGPFLCWHWSTSFPWVMLGINSTSGYVRPGRLLFPSSQPLVLRLFPSMSNRHTHRISFLFATVKQYLTVMSLIVPVLHRKQKGHILYDSYATP